MHHSILCSVFVKSPTPARIRRLTGLLGENPLVLPLGPQPLPQRKVKSFKGG